MYRNPHMSMMRLLAGMLVVLALVGERSFAGDPAHGPALHTERFEHKPTPDDVLSKLIAGNERFIAGQSNHPHTDSARFAQAGSENQGDHAIATVITCSDSRVPVERVFDAGIMDLFVIRVAGNVCDTDEIGSIEYGLAHVNTPVLVVLGHTQCGAVTAVSKTFNGEQLVLELNIPPLVDNIGPAIQRTAHEHPDASGSAFVELAVEENVRQSMLDLFRNSPATRELVNGGYVRVVGAVYDVATGQVRWLPEAVGQDALAAAEQDPARETDVFFASQAPAHDTNASAEAHGGSSSPSVAGKPITLIDQHHFEEMHQQAVDAREAERSVEFSLSDERSNRVIIGVTIAGLLIIATILALTMTGQLNRLKVAPKLYIGFGTLIGLSLVMWSMSRYFRSDVEASVQMGQHVANVELFAAQMARLENEFMAIGASDIELGEEIVEEHHTTAARLQEEIDLLRDQVHTHEELLAAIDQMDDWSHEYAVQFRKLTEGLHEIEEIREQKHKIDNRVESSIQTLVEQHKNELHRLERTPNASPVQIGIQADLLALIEEAEIHWLRAYTHQNEYLISRHYESVTLMGSQMGMLLSTLDKIEERIDALQVDEAERDHERSYVETIREAMGEIEAIASRLIEDQLEVDLAAARSAYDIDEIQLAGETLNAYVEHHIHSVERSAGTAETVVLFFVVVIGVLMSIVIARSISKPVSAFVERLTYVSDSLDLTVRVDESGRDELAVLGRGFNNLLVTVNDMLLEVSAKSEAVAAASTEIAASNEEIAAGMGEQTTQLNQISSAMEEISASIVEVAQKSNDASDLASGSGRVATEGGEVVRETIDGMDRINEAVCASSASIKELRTRAEQIGEIVTVINDIADQTNLLALNAAIEAARAGENGRGFAVVADEVRKLADRTTSATGEIGDSIQSIQEETQLAIERIMSGTTEVQYGMTKANQAGDSLKRIVESAQSVASVIASIAAAAGEQSTASREASRSIEQISAVTTQTNEATGQAAQAASQLSESAESLRTLVARFKTAATSSPKSEARASK